MPTANDRGTVIMSDRATITGNKAGLGAGGISNSGGSVILSDRASITGNEAVRNGGGIATYRLLHRTRCRSVTTTPTPAPTRR
jgi:hypothetical protein